MSMGQRGSEANLIWFKSTPLFFLAGVLALILIDLSFLALRCPTGPQPVTFGHIQTLANLIDDWGDDIRKPLYWGEKRSEELVGVVGTTPFRDRVRELDLSREYE